jgi:hypothetical protein
MLELRFAAIAAVAAVAAACAGRDVTGHACIAFDLRNPGLCGEMQDVGGLRVVEVGSGQHTMTDGDGEFSIAIPEHATTAVLRVADDREDRRTTLVDVPVAPADDVLAPVIATTLWNVYLAALHVPPEDPSRATVHVSLPPPGELLGSVQVAGATQLLYNQGEPFIWAELPPGDQTPAIMAFGVPVDAGTAMVSVVSRSDQVLYNAEVPVQAGAITWVRVEP